jgi:hypothetical protein
MITYELTAAIFATIILFPLAFFPFALQRWRQLIAIIIFILHSIIFVIFAIGLVQEH